MHTDDVLYNKFNVDYNTESPEVPDNPPEYPDDEYCAVATDKGWKVDSCTEKRHVVCEGGLKHDIDVVAISRLYASSLTCIGRKCITL